MHLKLLAATHAATLIEAGKIKNSDHWTPPSAAQEDHFIAQHGLAEFGRWHLGLDSEAGEESKARYGFPFTSDFEKVDYAGLRACITRAAQAGYAEIEARARSLYEEAGKKLGKGKSEDRMPKPERNPNAETSKGRARQSPALRCLYPRTLCATCRNQPARRGLARPTLRAPFCLWRDY